MIRGVAIWRTPALALALLFAPSAAQAHLVETGLGPLYDGAAHLAASPEQSVPLLGAALYAGLGGKACARLAILLLPAAWFIGNLLGGLSGAPNLAAPAWLFLLIAGGLVAADLRPPVRGTAACVAAMGFALGYSNGLATAQFPQSARAALGATAAIFVAASFVAAAASAASGWKKIAVRVAGSWIAASGLLALGWALR
jgi:hydrogenase/urease accessory protein HupE